MPDPFPDNWTYLRTELNWLDRVLAGAIARQRKETTEVNRVSKARVDQVTSHWWKGIIQVEGTAAGDSPADFPRRNQTKGNFQQQMETRIQASQQQGIVLGLPSLCQKLDLSTFEKNVVLLALAPEVSRRYGRLYNFLQETDHPGASGLPTIDLILRLMCRNDSEWRSARLAFSAQAKLLQHEIVVLPQTVSESFLSHPVKLTDAIAEYLLADMPHLATLDSLLTPTVAVLRSFDEPLPMPATWAPEQVLERPGFSPISTLPPPAHDLWSTLILPKQLQANLRHLSDRLRYAQRVQDPCQGASGHLHRSGHWGAIVLLVGAPGTGKTLAARAIAQSLQTALTSIDLAMVDPAYQNPLLHDLTIQDPPVVLIKSAQHWLGRSSLLSAVALRQFFQARQQSPRLTLFSVEDFSSVKASWQSWFITTLKFSHPNKTQRLQLWQHAFPPEVSLAADINWQDLAQLTLTGGMIQAIAHEAAIYAAADPANALAGQVGMKHLRQACQFLGWG